jgi:SAM-dependent methyltransferase
MGDLPHSPAADRNKQPILEVLRRILGERGAALEIASGTGQHVVWFAAALRQWLWQPTDADASMLPAIASRVAQAGLANLRPPLLLDVMAPQWPSREAPFAQRFDAIYCANMLHIAPPATCAALMEGAARHLVPGGVLVTYGPYFEEGIAAPSNQSFDESLRARDPSWGIRRLEDVATEARRSGLALRERHVMPANNLLLVFGA